MAKKYLLYIHDSRFNEEPNKSGLINKLLNKHYGIDDSDIVVEPVEGKKIIEVVAELIAQPCKHGADPNFCRFSKPGKPCK